MNTTSPSLLCQLRQHGEEGAWVRFVNLYSPLLHYWARQVGMQDQDAADMTQDVLATLVQKLPEFRYDPQSSFRSWLRTIVLNKWRNGRRGKKLVLLGTDHEALQEIPDNAAAAFEEVEYRQYLTRRALELMQAEFPPKMWQACWEHVVAGRPAVEVAAELGISAGTVYVAKGRILARLRSELEGLLE